MGRVDTRRLHHGNDTAPSYNGFFYRQKTAWAFAPVPVLVLLLAFFLSVESNRSYESPLILGLLNTLFLTAIPLWISYYAARSSILSRSSVFLWLGAGMVALAWGSFLGGLTANSHRIPNAIVTLHNTGCFIAAVCQFYCGFAVLTGDTHRQSIRRICIQVVFSYLAVTAFMIVLAFLALHRQMPVFFVEDQGPTVLRQAVLSAATILFAISSLVVDFAWKKTGHAFFSWYRNGLLLITIGLVALFFQKEVGSPLDWLGRIGQYAGGVYLMISLFTIRREFDASETSAEKALQHMFTHRLEQELELRRNELKKTEAMLHSVQDMVRESEERGRRLFENDLVAMLIIDGETLRIEDANDAAVRLYGYGCEELTSRMTAADLSAESEAPETAFRRSALTGAAEYVAERLHRRKDGSVFPVEMVLGRCTSGGRKIIYALANDLTDRKRAEEEKRILMERVRRLEKMEISGVLAGGVAHDLNNILGVLVGYSELLADRLSLHHELQEDVLAVMDSGRRAATVVQDLLTMSRRGAMTTSPCSLNMIVADQLKTPELAALRASRPEIMIDAVLGFGDFIVDCSAVHIGKALMNLVLNAADAIPKDGGIYIRTARRHLALPWKGYEEIAAGDYAILSVEDTGSGIGHEHLRHIFEPFYSRKQMGRNGSGLGLAVVWATVKDHNGYIDVVSTQGKGTSFTLYFPLCRDVVCADARTQQERCEGRGESVLIVEDDEGNRRLIKRMLAKLNYAATAVASGEEAIAYFAENRADLVILDMIMDPGMDGLDTYREIAKIRPGQKAVIVSGYSETDRTDEARHLGVGTFLKKPYLMADLGAAARKEIDRK
jgi:two-component system, cell cycle sensor histidine kinase and response regulator CckA